MSRSGDEDTPPPARGSRSKVSRDLTNLAGVVGSIAASLLEAARIVDTAPEAELVDYVTRLARELDEVGLVFPETARALEGLITKSVELK